MNAICITCGTQYRETEDFPSGCTICCDDRQYVGFDGQQWTSLERLQLNYRTRTSEEERRLTSLWMHPNFGIGQRAFLIQTDAGNVLWDCISLFDAAAIEAIGKLGGLRAIAISHPHYYTCMVEWSRVFGDVPIYLHQDDVQWVMRPDKRVHLWNGETCDLPGGLKLIRCGGHFEGACVLHWPEGADGRGALLTADIIQVVPDRRWVSFMYSYPNYIPLSARQVARIVTSVQPLAFDSIYGAFPQMTVVRDGKLVVERSAERYLKAIAPE